MLRRRIFASAMASVMALSSVAVVANAEDAEKNVMSRTDLQKLIDDTMAMRDDAIYEYGSNSGQDFLDALEYADNVLADSGSTLTDYTVAYKMVMATKDALKKYTADELKTLIESCKKMYESDNILNEELGDLIYDAEKFDAFAAAYEEAERVINSTDSRIITDAYDELNAKKSISPLTAVTKAQMRTALKNYEALILRMSDYDSWRRGTVDGWVDVASGKFWIFSKNAYTTYDDILNVVFGSGAVTKKNEQYPWGEVVVQGATGIVHVGNTNTCTTTVLEFIREQYEIFDDIKTASKTSNEEIVKAYRAMQDAVAVYNTWSADKTTRATKSSVQKLLDQYHAQMVAKYKKTSAEDLYAVFTTADPDDAKDVVDGDWTDAAHEYYGAVMKNDGDKKKIDVDANGYWTTDADAVAKQVDVAKRVDILKYIEVTSADITDANVAAAVEIAEKYLAEQWDDEVYGLDEIGTVTAAKGSVAEWTLVYRNLYYALTDTFNGAPDATYTKADVKALIEDCYKLAEDTGDSAIFDKDETGNLHTTLVDARQAAQNWVRAATAQKLYKDGETFYDVATGLLLVNSTDAYKMLKGHYDALAKELARYKYSYQEIYNYINDVAELIDDGEIKATDDVVSALKDTALKLSTLTPTDDEDNLAFTADREFKGHNRLFTDGDANNGEEKALQAAYEALVAAVKKQTEAAAVVVGDVNGDGAVNAADATEILKANVGLRDAIEVAVGDVTADGVVNAADATQILKTLIGL